MSINSADELFDYSLGILTTPLDHRKATDTIELLYRNYAGRRMPQVIFDGSPFDILRRIDTNKKLRKKNSIYDDLTDRMPRTIFRKYPEFSPFTDPISVLGSFIDSPHKELVIFVGSAITKYLTYKQTLRFYTNAYYSWLLLQMGVRQLLDPTQSGLNFYQQVAENLHFFMPFEDVCYVSERPIKMAFNQDTRFFSCEDGVAIEYPNGDALYVIDGIQVTKQIVESPSTLSVKQINEMPNVEARRIAIARYGWSNYLAESNATILDVNFPTEVLIKGVDHVVLCTFDPSTGRFYALEVSPRCQTCAEAQQYLLSPDLALAGLNMSKIKGNYPKLRT